LSGWFARLHISAILVLVVIAIVSQWIQLFLVSLAAGAMVAAHEVPL
jgi:hypothetical protein